MPHVKQNPTTTTTVLYHSIMNAKELNKVARDLTKQAEEILAMAKYFSDLADREALRELREEWQATPPVSEDWDEELRREGEAQAFAIPLPRCKRSREYWGKTCRTCEGRCSHL